jgi:predicted small secreted protein
VRKGTHHINIQEITMKKLLTWLIIALLAAGTVSVAGCGEMKNAGDDAGEAIEDAGEATMDAVDNAGEAIEDAGEATMDAVEELGRPRWMRWRRLERPRWILWKMRAMNSKKQPMKLTAICKP